MSVNNQLRLYETRTFLDRQNTVGVEEKEFYIVSGSRVLVTLKAAQIDIGATVTLSLHNGFSREDYEIIDTVQLTAAGTIKRVYNDFHNMFKLSVAVVGGNASYKVAVAIFDNASTTRIDNAQIDVSLDHTVDVMGHFDSIRIGDGTDLLSINPDGSINLPATDGTGSLEVRTDYRNNVKYVGVAAPGSLESDAVWRITKTTNYLNNITDSNDEVILIAGSGGFDQIWDDRESLFPVEAEIDFYGRKTEKILTLLANANWMKLGDFDKVTPSFTNEYVTMNYYQNEVNIGRAVVRYINDLDWQIDLNRFINDDDGSLLLDDDGSELFLD